MSDERILRVLRTQAWERAKGELQAVLQTYFAGGPGHENYQEMEQAVSQFIKHVEDNGLQE